MTSTQTGRRYDGERYRTTLQAKLVDRFTDWVVRLPMPGWTFYLGLGLGLILIQVLILWLDDGLDVAGVLLPVIVFNGLAIPLLLPLMHLLDDQAVTALDAMRPTLEMTEPEFDEFWYKLANIPSRAPLIACLAVLLFAILMERLGTAPARFAALEQLPLFAIVFQIFDKGPAFVFGAFFYHTVSNSVWSILSIRITRESACIIWGLCRHSRSSLRLPPWD